jgi:light-harvesting complex II chlorophyll a/b binding protein 4
MMLLHHLHAPGSKSQQLRDDGTEGLEENRGLVDHGHVRGEFLRDEPSDGEHSQPSVEDLRFLQEKLSLDRPGNHQVKWIEPEVTWFPDDALIVPLRFDKFQCGRGTNRGHPEQRSRLVELAHGVVASGLGLPETLLSSSELHGKVPSVLNGGLDQTAPLFWVAAIGAAAALEFIETKRNDEGVVGEPGNFGFDPFNLMISGSIQRQFFLKEAEIFNGRLAMLAITGFVAQEFATNVAVIDQTPIFFKPFGAVVAQLLGLGAGSV